MAEPVPNRAHDPKRRADRARMDKLHWAPHMYTEGTDEEYGYPLKSNGDWALEENMDIHEDDNVSEAHTSPEHCAKTDCQYPHMNIAERKPWENWYAEYHNY